MLNKKLLKGFLDSWTAREFTLDNMTYVDTNLTTGGLTFCVAGWIIDRAFQDIDLRGSVDLYDRATSRGISYTPSGLSAIASHYRLGNHVNPAEMATALLGLSRAETMLLFRFNLPHWWISYQVNLMLAHPDQTDLGGWFIDSSGSDIVGKNHLLSLRFACPQDKPTPPLTYSAWWKTVSADKGGLGLHQRRVNDRVVTVEFTKTRA